ncbi:uncharacterized protein LOC119093645 [Pollicipes pollicipes]|uniref:uncharacterized protein LOC119093645 n=1 Tax=Pollicipes pollicipes TaxID=41117 RepID=UPI00188504CB|nr:uncharacterized protein LOC119093645 [Pollicipes pollicipes]
MDAFFQAVRLGDADGCGMRLVCELRTLDPRFLGEEGNMILALFGSDVPSSGRADSPKRLYDAAAELGSSTGTAEVCAQTFTACEYDSETLLEAITSPEEQ